MRHLSFKKKESQEKTFIFKIYLKISELGNN